MAAAYAWYPLIATRLAQIAYKSQHCRLSVSNKLTFYYLGQLFLTTTPLEQLSYELAFIIQSRVLSKLLLQLTCPLLLLVEFAQLNKKNCF